MTQEDDGDGDDGGGVEDRDGGGLVDAGGEAGGLLVCTGGGVVAGGAVTGGRAPVAAWCDEDGAPVWLLPPVPPRSAASTGWAGPVPDGPADGAGVREMCAAGTSRAPDGAREPAARGDDGGEPAATGGGPGGLVSCRPISVAVTVAPTAMTSATADGTALPAHWCINGLRG
jgi:hypothetical protein